MATRVDRAAPRPPRNTLPFSTFCENLGMPLRNKAWSWCGYSPAKHRAIFTIWADLLIDGRYLIWDAKGADHQTRNGAIEIRRVLDSVQSLREEAYGVLCYANNPAKSPRSRDRFIEDTLLVLNIVEEAEGTVCYVVGEVPTSEVLAGRVGPTQAAQSALDDLGAPPPGSDAPVRVVGQGQGYRRDDAVRRYVVRRANGVCEYCKQPDFLMEGDVSYLEAHHIIRLSMQGPDRVDNVIALCSRHHREAHYGKNAEALEREFQAILKSL